MADIFTTTLTRGAVRLDDPTPEDCVICHSDVQVWEIDLDSKYAEVFAIGGNSKIYLGGNERTLHLDPDASLPTTLTFNNVPEDFILHAYVSRYTLYAFLYRRAG